MGCFCEGCYSTANTLGYDLDQIKQSVLKLRSWIREKDNIKRIAEEGITSMDVIGKLFSEEKLSDWFQFKFESSNKFTQKIQQTVQKLDSSLELHMDFVTPSFCPISGTDVTGLNKYCDIVNPKLYPTAGYWGWHNRLSDYAEFILKENNLKEYTVVRFSENLFGLEGMSEFESVKDLKEKTFPVEFFKNETQKVAEWVDDSKKIRPWVWIDNEEIDEIRNIFRGISEVNVEGVFVKQYSSATEEKLNIIQEEFGL